MRVCIIGSRGFPVVYSGYETLVAHLAPGLVRRGFEVTVYCHRHLFDQRPREVDGVRLVYLPGLRGKRFAQYSHTACAALHAIRRQFDVALVLNVANGLFVPLLNASGTATVVNVDGVEWKRPKWSGLGSRVFRVAAGIASRRSTALVTDAEAMRLLYLQEYRRESTVIAYGADVPAMAEITFPAALASYGLTPGGYVLILGRLIPDNNGELLLRAYLESGVAERLVVVGDVPYRDQYATDLRRLGGDRVLFTGYVTDQNVLRALVGNARLYLHGHEFGGTNPSLLLAMSTGVPIVALDTAFAREVLPEDPGVDFFPKQVREAAATIRRCVIDAPTAPVEALRERVRSRYQWARIVDEYAGLLESVASVR